MSPISPFYSVNEVYRTLDERIHHDDDACPVGRGIPTDERLPGTGNYRRCEECVRLGKTGR